MSTITLTVSNNERAEIYRALMARALSYAQLISADDALRLEIEQKRLTPDFDYMNISRDQPVADKTRQMWNDNLNALEAIAKLFQ